MLDNTVASTIIRNTAFNAAGAFAAMLSSFIVTPLILSAIGLEQFGIWALSNTFAAYFIFFDVGIKAPMIKFTAEFKASAAIDKLYELINSSIVLYALLAAVLSAAGWFCAPAIVEFFAVTGTLAQEAVFVMRCVGLSAALLIFFNIFESVLVGLQRMGITNRNLILVSLANIGATALVVRFGWGLRGLGLSMLGVTVLKGCLNMFFVGRLLRPRWGTRYLNPSLFRTLFAFSWKVSIALLAFLAAFQMDKILIGRALTVSAVAFYELGSKIAFTVRRCCSLLLSAFLPVVSSVNSLDQDGENSFALYSRSFKYVAFVSIPFFLFVAANAGVILAFWTGSGYDQAVPVIRILCLGYCANTLLAVATTSAMGMGRPELEMRYALLYAPINLFLSIVAITKWGVLGACWATSFSLILGAIVFFLIFHGYIRKPLRPFFGFLWKPAAVSIVSTVFCAPLDRIPYIFPVMSLRWNLCILLGIKGIAFFSVYLAILQQVKFFDARDIEFIGRIPVMGRLLNLCSKSGKTCGT